MRPPDAEKLERSLALALEHDLEEHVARAYTNLATKTLDLADYPAADRYLAEGIEYSRERDLDAWVIYMTGHLARSHMNQGRWDAAVASAQEVLADPRESSPSRVWPLLVMGVVRARRGDPDPWPPLDEARDLAEGIGELQRLAPVAAARAEAHWLAGDADAIDAETSHALALALERRDACAAGELQLWRRRAGIEEAVAPKTISEPYRLELQGDHEAAAQVWRRHGCPYEAALALAHSAREEAQREALAELQRLGARPATARVARALREGGARDVRQGPRTATRDNPGGLTARELEVRGAARRRAPQRRDRRAPLHVRAHRRPPRLGDPAQARGRHPRSGRCRGGAARNRPKIGTPADVRRSPCGVHFRMAHDLYRETTMNLYAILRRNGWKTGEELQAAAARSTRVGNEEMPNDIRWIRSYVLDEGNGAVGTVCIYQATEPRGDPRARVSRGPAGGRDHPDRRHRARAPRSRRGDGLRSRLEHAQGVLEPPCSVRRHRGVARPRWAGVS